MPAFYQSRHDLCPYGFKITQPKITNLTNFLAKGIFPAQENNCINWRKATIYSCASLIVSFLLLKGRNFPRFDPIRIARSHRFSQIVTRQV
jgi:hypothetical protein